MSITTIGNKSKAIVLFEDCHGINITVAAAEALPKAAVVKMGVDGRVSAVTAATDIPIGVIASGGKEENDLVTVITDFIIVAHGKANGAGVDPGVEVSATALDPADNLMDYTVSASTHRVAGVVLEGGADNEEILVGVFGQAYIKP